MDERKKTKLRLSTPAEVRRALGKVTNMVFNGEIDTKRANTIVYACNSLLTSIRTDDQEERIQKLEEMMKNEK